MTESGLTHYIHVLRRNLWIVVLVCAVVTTATFYVSHRQSKLFRSSAGVFLSSQSAASGIAGVQTPAEDPVRQAATQANLARTPTVAKRALHLAGLSTRSAGTLLKNSSVTPAPNADILTFSVDDGSSQLAARLAGAYAQAYTQYRRQLDSGGTRRALRDVTSRLDELKSSGLDHTAAYADLLEKQQELSTLQILQASNAMLVRSASPAVQIRPRPVRNVAVAAVLAIVIGLSIALLREALDTRIRSTAEIQQRLDLPQLARISEQPRRFRKPNRLIMLEEPYGPEGEAYRILATNLDFVNLDKGARTVMFTSASHSEGKSTTVANLSVALARTGRRVALVDLDLRKPTIAAMFHLREDRGLTTVALGRDDLEDVIHRVAVSTKSSDSSEGPEQVMLGTLQVLTVGPIPPNPGEFVGSSILESILAAVSDQVDIVLIDAPPLLNLSDAMTLASRVSGLVVVARVPLLKRSMLQELRRVLDALPIAKLGFVATGTSPSNDSYGEYGYGSTYGAAFRESES